MRPDRRPRMCPRLAAAAALLVTAASGNAHAAFLTGATLFSAQSNGAYSSENFWNTRGGDGGANLYITQANSGANGAFLNSGNGAGASINVDLSAPGSYQFYFFANAGGGSGGTFRGLHLFFDGAAPPRISALTMADTTPPPHPAFTANANALTLGLDLTIVPGSGVLLYSSGGTTITLTEYRASEPFVESRNRVGFFNNAPDGDLDTVGSFTLTVNGPGANPVPAPPGVVLLASGCAVFGLMRLRRAFGRG